MASFGDFTVARLGMIASQMALNVTGQNISNINTTGYTRQQLDQYSFITNGGGLYRSSSSASVGSGVLLAGVSQLRDPYLDIRFRKEMASVGSTDATLNVLDQLQSVINNVDKEGIVTQLQDLFSRISELGSHVGEQEFETLMRESAEDLCTLLNTSASKLQQVFDNIKQQYEESIQDTNNLLEKIQDLNEQIRIADINGDSALELRDERNMLIDSLSEKMKIDVTYGKEDVGAGFEIEKLTIKMVDASTGKPGATLIDGINRAELSQVADDPLMRINVSELHDPKGKVVSNTSSSTIFTGLQFADGITTGPQNVTVNYLDANGQEQSTTISFTVTAPADNTPEAKQAAREATLKSLTDAMNASLGGDFSVKQGDNGLIVTSDGVGEKAFTLTGLDFPANTVSFQSQQVNAAVPSNDTLIEEGMGYGALESLRQMLIGEGEFRADGGDSSIRGIPYYMKSLDMLANKFATEMNRVNTTDAEGNSMVGVIEGAGNLFVADGDDPDNPTKTITAANISISDKWQTGEVNVVPSTNTDENAGSTENDNINRFQNILNQAFDYKATDIARQDQTPFISGAFTQTGAAGTNLKAQITYIDSMNQKHTVTVSFQSGNTPEDTLNNLQAAIAGNTELQDRFTAEVTAPDNNTITIKDKDTDEADGVLCDLVTDIKITDDQGAATDDFQMGAGKIGGTVASSNIYKGNLESCYSNMEGVLGSHINTTATIYETYAIAADDLNTSRDSVSGVDLNDEGINLLQYQKSFSAACRLMTALDEAMDKVINGMGVVGR